VIHVPEWTRCPTNTLYESDRDRPRGCFSNQPSGVVTQTPMADTWITDLTHFLEDGRLPQELPGAALRLVEYLGRIVAAVTGAEPDDSLGVCCRRRPGRRPCPGEIAGYIVPESNAICWRCLVCGDNGLISKWENTVWDLREADEHARH